MAATEPGESGRRLTVTATADKDVVGVKICGEVDLVTREELRLSIARLQLGDARLVFLDVGQPTFCDGAGAAPLRASGRKRSRRGTTCGSSTPHR
jgi:hypothetical protein